MHNVPLLSVKPQGGGVGTSVISMVQGWYCLMSYHIDTVLDTNVDTHVNPYTKLLLVVVLTIFKVAMLFTLQNGAIQRPKNIRVL
jgi:hypothetical protein